MFAHKFAPDDTAISKNLAQRWSPYGLSAKPVPEEDLASLFEAARWAASSYNEQPWRFVLVRKAEDKQAHADAVSCLFEANQVWAANAPILVFACTARRLGQSGKLNKAADHDLGLAVANLTFEAQTRGLFVHQIIGIEPDKVRGLYNIAKDVEPLTAFAIGYAQTHPDLPDHLRTRDAMPRQRRPLSETVFCGHWGNAALFEKPHKT